MITYTTYNTQLQVKIPFELKDLFKSNFKTAKWNNYMKTWDINDNAKNKNKLDLFINETAQLSRDIEIAAKAETELEYSENELRELKEEIKRLKKDIDFGKDRIESLREINKEIEAAKEEIEALKIELAEVNAAKEAESEDLEAFVDSLIDTDKLAGISYTISTYARKPFLYATEKQDLREALSYAHEAVDILKKAGFESRNVSRLSNTTLSRLDRDNFQFSSKDFYDIQKI